MPIDSGTVISLEYFRALLYGVQLAAAQGTTTISHNTLNDCSGFVEGNVTSPATPDTGCRDQLQPPYFYL